MLRLQAIADKEMDMPSLPASEGRCRVAISGVLPSVDDGRFAIKRIVGETIVVEADVFADGHDEVRAVLLTRRHGARQWNEQPMQFLGNDHWQAAFTPGARSITFRRLRGCAAVLFLAMVAPATRAGPDWRAAAGSHNGPKMRVVGSTSQRICEQLSGFLLSVRLTGFFPATT